MSKPSYEVVVGYTAAMLTRLVNESIERGYVPHGSAYALPPQHCQPMVKYNEPAVYLDPCGNRIE